MGIKLNFSKKCQERVIAVSINVFDVADKVVEITYNNLIIIMVLVVSIVFSVFIGSFLFLDDDYQKAHDELVNHFEELGYVIVTENNYSQRKSRILMQEPTTRHLYEVNCDLNLNSNPNCQLTNVGAPIEFNPPATH
jgi:hypothetical protein